MNIYAFASRIAVSVSATLSAVLRGSYLPTFSSTGYHLISLFFFFFFRAAPVVHAGSQVRGSIGAIAAGLCQSHGNSGSELHL